MGTRPPRQQTTEKIGAPLELGFGTVHIERRNGSPIPSARAYIQGKHKGVEHRRDRRKGRTPESDRRFFQGASSHRAG